MKTIDYISLERIRALVTRPIEFSTEVVTAITEKQGFAYALPMQKCMPLNQNIIIKQIQQQPKIDYIIVTSRFAAMYSIPVLKKNWKNFAFVKQWYCLSIGTALELKKLGVESMYPSNGVTSEHLLRLISLAGDLNGKNILILKGNNGRNFLQQNLALKQAQVTPIETYIRSNIDYKKQQVISILNRYNCNSIICGNSEAIRHLRTFISDNYCNNYMLIVPTKRQVQLANDLGFSYSCCADGIDKNKVIYKLNAIKSTILRLQNGKI